MSIKGALDLIDHGDYRYHKNSDDESQGGARRHMKLSRKEEEMMGHVKSKMRYAGETYHRVAAPDMEVNLLKAKRKQPDFADDLENQEETDSYNVIEFHQSGLNKYQKTDHS